MIKNEEARKQVKKSCRKKTMSNSITDIVSRKRRERPKVIIVRL